MTEEGFGIDGDVMESFIFGGVTADGVPLAFCGLCRGRSEEIKKALEGARNMIFGEYRSGYTVDYRLSGLLEEMLSPFGEDVIFCGASAEVRDALCPTGGILGRAADRPLSAEKERFIRDGFTFFTSPGEYAFAVEGEDFCLPAETEELLGGEKTPAEIYMAGLTGVSRETEMIFKALEESGREFLFISDGSGGRAGAVAVRGDILSLGDVKRRMNEEKSFFGLKRIGVMGGTFDPIHNGHLMAAEAVRERLGLERVVFIPTGETPYKKRGVTPPRHRYAMAALAAQTNPHFTVSSLEISRKGFSYTADTMGEMRKLCDADAEIYFITGADVLEDMEGWRNFAGLAEICSFAAVKRPGYEATEAVGKLLKRGVRIEMVEAPALDISSSMIRRSLHTGGSVKYLMPGAVEKYIKLHGLYSGAGNDRGLENLLEKLI